MMLSLLLLSLFGGAFALVLVPRRALLPTATSSLVIALALAMWAATTQPVVGWSWWGPRLQLELAVGGIGRMLVVLVPVIAIPVVIYAAASVRSDPGARRLLALLVAFTGAMELLALAADFLTLLIAWELVGACSWALIGHDWRDAARPRAALSAFITTRAGDLGLYLAAAAILGASGSVRFDALRSVDEARLHVVAAGVLLASAAKSAQLPFSPWLFSAMAGPTAASALLHSATMVAAGAFLLARLSPLLAPTGWFLPTVAWLGLATALAGGVVALIQSDLKKALAASTSAQYGLMLVAIGAGFPAVAGLHLVTHAAFKALLFLGAGVALHAAGTGDLRRLALGTALPRVAGLFAVGALALAAVPPLGGGYSKEQIISAAAQGMLGGAWMIVGVMAAGFLSTLYAGRLYLLAFGPGRTSGVDAPAPGQRASLAVLAGLSIALGLLWLPGAASVVEQVLGSELPHGTPLLLAGSLTSIAAAGVLSWHLWRRGALLEFGVPGPVRHYVAGWFGLATGVERLIVLPVLQLSRACAVFDNRVVDEGVGLAARVPRILSGVVVRWPERALERAVSAAGQLTTSLAAVSRVVDDRAIDRAVDAFARTVGHIATGSRVADDDGIDRAIEGLAREVGVAGLHSRRLQTGLAHHYYAIVAVGALGVFAVAAFWS